MGISDLMIPSHTTYLSNHCETSKDIPVGAFRKKECGCFETTEFYNSEHCFVMESTLVTNYYLYPKHMKERLAPVIKQQSSTEGCKKLQS